MSNLSEVRSKPIKITLNDGVEREIKFTLNAMAELEEKYGTVQAAFDAAEKNSFKAIRCIIWAGLLWSDDNITERTVGNLIDTQSLESITASLTKALGQDTPAVKEALPNV